MEDTDETHVLQALRYPVSSLQNAPLVEKLAHDRQLSPQYEMEERAHTP